MSAPMNPTPAPTRTIEDILKNSAELPTVPASLTEVVRLLDSSDSTAAQLAEAIMRDQSLSSRVLRMANSAFYGLPRKVNSLTDAIVLLGFKTIHQLAVIAGTVSWMSKPMPGYGLGARHFLLHSIGVATGAQMIARITRKGNPEIAFIAGLLADIGKIPIAGSLDGKSVMMFDLGLQAGMTFDEIEKRVIGFDHAEIGAAMAEAWNLPEELVHAIKSHHKPLACENETFLADCVHIGDYLTMTMGFGLGIDGMLFEFDQESLVRCGLSTNDLDSMIDAFVTAYEHQESLMRGVEA